MAPRLLKWEYGITTVFRTVTEHREVIDHQTRYTELLPNTIRSLYDAGFTAPRLFIDGCDYLDQYFESAPLVKEITTDLQIPATVRGFPPVRTAGNWVMSMWELYARNPFANYYALFQDDIIAVKDLREYLSKLDYPSRGYWNLFKFPESVEGLTELNDPIWKYRQLPIPHEGFVGFYESNQRGLGAVGLVFNRATLQSVFMSHHVITRFGNQKKGHKAIDGGIVEGMKHFGIKEYVHSPSLLQHQGTLSSMQNPTHPESDSFPGESFSALNFLETKHEQTSNC